MADGDHEPRAGGAWDHTADVVVVGLGGAGVCAAITAAEAGADVLALDRFGGGGATAMSGGVVYAGGGTGVQRGAGVADDPRQMLAYLRHEVGTAVTEDTLRTFCEQSAEQIEWLTEHGVPFEPTLCPYKTSYPSDRHYLYYSGSEAAWPYRESATPAPRGHRAHGPGTSGRVFFGALAESARAAGMRTLTQTRASALIRDADGRVVGVLARTLADAPAPIRALHRLLHRYATKPGLYVPALAKALGARVAALEARHSRAIRVRATRGVLLSSGGFIRNRAMLRTHAPSARGGLALGTQGDDGSGIRLGAAAGGATDRLDRVTAWRFLTPPSALLRGVLVDGTGRRFIDESSYGAAIGAAIQADHDGRAWLVLDRDVLAEAKAQLAGQTQWFQRLQGHYVLGPGLITGRTLAEVAGKAGIHPAGLTATVAAYGHQERDAFGKAAEYVRPLSHGPYALIDCSIRPRVTFPVPMLTLGGLVVDERTGQVRRHDGSGIPGLYAAGRTAVGICSNSYVSGLSLADCVFSGRRAGTHIVQSGRSCREASTSAGNSGADDAGPDDPEPDHPQPDDPQTEVRDSRAHG